MGRNRKYFSIEERKIANRMYNDASNLITANFTVSDTASLESAK